MCRKQRVHSNGNKSVDEGEMSPGSIASPQQDAVSAGVGKQCWLGLERQRMRQR